jgi:hypothetical protein
MTTRNDALLQPPCAATWTQAHPLAVRMLLPSPTLCPRPPGLRPPRHRHPVTLWALTGGASHHSDVLCALCQAQLEAVGTALGAVHKDVFLALYTRTPDSLALSTFRLERSAVWPAKRGGAHAPLASVFELATLGEEDVALLLRRQHVTLGASGTVVCPVASNGVLLGLLAAEGVSAAEESQPWAPPGAPWALQAPAAPSSVASAARASLGATARAVACALALEVMSVDARQRASDQAAEVASFVGRARQPLSALATVSAMLTRLADGSQQSELATALAGQTQRLAQLTASLEAALYAASPPALAPDARSPPALPGTSQAAGLLPAGETVQLTSHTEQQQYSTDVVAVLRPLLGAMDGVARLDGKRLIAELLQETSVLTAIAPADVKAALSAALQTGLHATPAGGTLRVRVAQRQGQGHDWGVDVLCLDASGALSAAAARQLGADPGLQVVATQLAALRGGCVVGTQLAGRGTIELTFPASHHARSMT